METCSRPDEIINFQIVFETRTLLWRVYVCQSFFFSFSPHLSVWSIVVADSRYHYDRLIVIVRFFTNLVFRDSTLRDFLFFSYGVNIAFEILSNEYLEY